MKQRHSYLLCRRFLKGGLQRMVLPLEPHPRGPKEPCQPLYEKTVFFRFVVFCFNPVPRTLRYEPQCPMAVSCVCRVWSQVASQRVCEIRVPPSPSASGKTRTGRAANRPSLVSCQPEHAGRAVRGLGRGVGDEDRSRSVATRSSLPVPSPRR